VFITAFCWICSDVVPERQDEVVYYDAFESPDAMKGEEGPATPTPPLRDEDIVVLQQRTRQLEARRGRITAKRVYLKNKKVSDDDEDDEDDDDSEVCSELH